jgi:hypothetical protein
MILMSPLSCSVLIQSAADLGGDLNEPGPPHLEKARKLKKCFYATRGIALQVLEKPRSCIRCVFH